MSGCRVIRQKLKGTRTMKSPFPTLGTLGMLYPGEKLVVRLLGCSIGALISKKDLDR